MALAQFIVRLWMTARLGASVFAAKSDCNVVKEDRLPYVRPELIGCPEEKRDCQHDGLHQFSKGRPVCGLIDQIGKRNHRQGKCAEKIMSFGGKASWKRIPCKEHADGNKRNAPDNCRHHPVDVIEADIHGASVPHRDLPFLSREIDILDLAHKRIHLVTRKAVA